MIQIDIEKKLKVYEGVRTLKVATEFVAGSITHIYGPSGAGKSTLLKIIAGFVQPEKGKISFEGLPWLDTSAKISLTPQERLAGFVFQDYALFPNMTVLQHLRYATKDDSWIDHLLQIGKLETLAKHKPEFLSGGQQQRLAILRALAIKPKLILMDEPFSALDNEIKSMLVADLRKLFAEMKITAVIVSHNLTELDGLTTHKLNLSF